MHSPLFRAPPTPAIREAISHASDLRAAVDRIAAARTAAQLEDATRSAEYFLEKVKQAVA